MAYRIPAWACLHLGKGLFFFPKLDLGQLDLLAF